MSVLSNQPDIPSATSCTDENNGANSGWEGKKVCPRSSGRCFCIQVPPTLNRALKSTRMEAGNYLFINSRRKDEQLLLSGTHVAVFAAEVMHHYTVGIPGKCTVRQQRTEKGLSASKHVMNFSKSKQGLKCYDSEQQNTWPFKTEAAFTTNPNNCKIIIVSEELQSETVVPVSDFLLADSADLFLRNHTFHLLMEDPLLLHLKPTNGLGEFKCERILDFDVSCL